jgi:hypothetical protein
MPHTLVLHVQNADAILAEVDELPSSTDTLVMVRNPRRIDGKDLHYISDTTVMVFWPVDKLNFIEVLSSAEEETIIGFVRE